MFLLLAGAGADALLCTKDILGPGARNNALVGIVIVVVVVVDAAAFGFSRSRLLEWPSTSLCW
jgi:hypothetical protein